MWSGIQSECENPNLCITPSLDFEPSLGGQSQLSWILSSIQRKGGVKIPC